MENVKATCDQCSKEFTVKVKLKKLRNHVEKTYFTCPQCEKVYTAFYTNISIRKQQAEVRKLYRKLQTLNAESLDKYEELLKVIENMQAEIKDGMNNLKHLYEG